MLAQRKGKEYKVSRLGCGRLKTSSVWLRRLSPLHTNNPFSFSLKWRLSSLYLKASAYSESSLAALEEEMATHSSILDCGITWTEEPGVAKDWTRLSNQAPTHFTRWFSFAALNTSCKAKDFLCWGKSHAQWNLSGSLVKPLLKKHFL